MLESGQKKEDIGYGQEHLSTGTDHHKTEGSRSALKQYDRTKIITPRDFEGLFAE
jgi:hypothetical protein